MAEPGFEPRLLRSEFALLILSGKVPLPISLQGDEAACLNPQPPPPPSPQALLGPLLMQRCPDAAPGEGSLTCRSPSDFQG